MKRLFAVSVVSCLCSAAIVAPALAQTTADFRVRAEFRAPDNNAWASNASIGHADFRIHSRYLAVYYGGVMRQDNFKLNVQVDLSEVSGFDTQFAGSPYNSNYDIFFDNFYMGRAIMGQSTPGIAELVFNSRHPEAPERPVPANWPSPIEIGTVVRVFFAPAGPEPTFGSPLPAGATPIVTSSLQEEFARGDVNQDGEVDLTDFQTLHAEFDPSNLSGPHIGPARGDFTGDNRADAADYNTMALNWTDDATIPPLPVACLDVPAAPAAVNACRGQAVAFTTAGAGTGPFNYQWRRNGVNISNAANPTARAATLNIPSAASALNGSYDCLVSNTCGSVATSAAALLVCDSDFNCSGTSSTQDVFDFLAAYFSADIRADINGAGGVSVQDIFDFLAAFFAGC